MNQQKVDMYIMSNMKYFPSEKVMYLKERLNRAEEEKYGFLATVELKDPTTMLLLSIFLGSFGIDRFMLGETGMGVLKLLTCGCCGIFTVIDWFTISNKAKELNYNNVMALL